MSSAVVLAPITREDSALGVEALMERGPGIGRQDVERGVLDACRLEEVPRLLKNRFGIMIEAKDDSRLY